ncbi:MAG TPA: hypothetical protein DEP53_04960 [Bacteroidetes bacterium]|nr:MAG: hypothetical protein A2X66_03665 [Ignavibacteria bacterium GWA2_54_16]HCA79066.1 hypothetical protein [Bacteroidota bacterium]
MKRSLAIFILLFSVLTYSSGQHLGFSGNLYVALENWSKVGDGSDSKIGIGLGGMIGLALNFDSTMTFAAGPHFSYNSWTADYSKKPQSFTESVVLNMQDTGIEFSLVFDDIGLFLGTGKSKMEHYMTLTTGTKVPYYGLDGKTTNYTSVGFTFALSPFFIGAGYTSYADFAKDASRAEVRLGLRI